MAAIRSLLARRLRTDAGLTLVELLVTMFLTGVVGSLVVGAVVQAGRVLTQTDDEERGLQDAKVILDRLGRDVRESRGVECDGGLANPADPTSAASRRRWRWATQRSSPPARTARVTGPRSAAHSATAAPPSQRSRTTWKVSCRSV